VSDEPLPKKKTSPWVYIGIGCLTAILLLVGGVFLLGFFAVRGVKNMAAEMSDPTVRTAKIQKMLGATTLPEGYKPAFALSVGPFMEMALLSDREPDAKGMVEGFDKHGFWYMRLMETQDNGNLRDYMDGKRDDPGLRNANVSFHSTDVIKRGGFEMNGETLRYVAQRGEFQSQQVSHRGITNVMMLECPGDKRTRIAFWFGPDPDPEKPIKQIDLKGTTADEAALKDFMSYFKPCQDS
jgi:hypothetical protein